MKCHALKPMERIWEAVCLTFCRSLPRGQDALSPQTKCRNRMNAVTCGLVPVCLIGAGILPPSSLTFAELALEYQSRGSYKEGIRAKPVSGNDIELISVLVDYQEPIPSKSFPKRLKVQFYLEKEMDKSEVAMTVRELDYRVYYWLDSVKPKTPWGKGFQNVFTWPTDRVLNQLPQKMDMYELGALVRVNEPTVLLSERVAPAVLYHTQPPEHIEGYLFTLKTAEDSRLTFAVIQEETGKKVWTKTFRRKRAGRPFTIPWNAGEAAVGFYRAEISGFSLFTNDEISKNIRWFHQPSLHP